MKYLPARLRHVAVICYMALLIMLSFSAQAQTDALHLLGAGQLRLPPPPQNSARLPPLAAPLMVAPQSGLGSFVLRQIVIDGTSSASPAALQEAAAPAIGHRVNGADISLIGQRIGLAEAAAGIALYSVSLPAQKIQNGVVHFRVTEASVVHVEIAGAADPKRLQLIRSYAQNILRSRPLRSSVLERNILLMGDITGTKVGSKFVPLPKREDAVTLVLAVQQTKFFGGFSLNNQGSPLLDNTQAVFNAGVNDLLHEGERTQLILGLPLDVSRYQYYGIKDIEPIGGNGMTSWLNAGEFVDHAVHHNVVSGTADLLAVGVEDPIRRSVHQDVSLGGEFDYLNSSDAVLGSTISDERTRLVRISLSYNDDKYFNGVNRVDASVSEGLDIFGARRAVPFYGGPGFTRENLTAERDQLLPGSFVLRLAIAGQTTTDRLPPSQEYQYGGADYGMAFYAAELSGDEGLAGLAQLSHVIPPDYLPKMLQGSSVFTAVDYGRIWNRNRPAAVPPTDRGASFAAGARLLLLGKVQVQLAAAMPMITPQTVGNNQRWRFIIGTSGQF